MAVAVQEAPRTHDQPPRSRARGTTHASTAEPVSQILKETRVADMCVDAVCAYADLVDVNAR